MASQKPFLDVQNLTKTFGAQVIFDNISFSIAEGQKVGLIAKNGTGKSTLLSILTGKEEQRAGGRTGNYLSASQVALRCAYEASGGTADVLRS